MQHFNYTLVYPTILNSLVNLRTWQVFNDVPASGPGYLSNINIRYADEIQNNADKSGHGSRGRACDSRSERKNSVQYFISLFSDWRAAAVPAPHHCSAMTLASRRRLNLSAALSSAGSLPDVGRRRRMWRSPVTVNLCARLVELVPSQVPVNLSRAQKES